jgi:hypothetical protein
VLWYFPLALFKQKGVWNRNKAPDALKKIPREDLATVSALDGLVKLF